MTLKASLDALHHDAGMWDRVAQVTNVAGQDASGLTLGESELSWASVNTPLLATYQQMQEKMARLMAEATTVYQGLSRTLDSVAVAYERNDEQAAGTFKGVWDVK